MTDYARQYDFSVKDDLPANNPGKVISGQEVDEEFDAIKDSIETKSNSASPTFTGTVTVTGATLVGFLPPGLVAPYAGSTEPTGGWIFCDGSEISRTTYSDLFTAISTQFGVGDGSTTFNVPDLRGRAVFGKDDMNSAIGTGGGDAGVLDNTDAHDLDGDTLGDTGGEAEHTVTSSEMPAHTHGAGSYAVGSHTHDEQAYQSTPGGGTNTIQGDGGNSAGIATGSPTTPTAAATPSFSGTSGSTGSGSAMPLIPPGIVLNYIIKT